MATLPPPVAPVNGRRRRSPTAPAEAEPGRSVQPPRLAFTIDRALYVVDYADDTDPAAISTAQHADAASRLLTRIAERDDDSLFHLNAEGTVFLLLADGRGGWVADRTFTLTGIVGLTTGDGTVGTCV